MRLSLFESDTLKDISITVLYKINNIVVYVIFIWISVFLSFCRHGYVLEKYTNCRNVTVV